jgi:hypothetical protein
MLSEGKEIAYKCSVVPVVRVDQVDPELDVFKINPKLPTMYPVLLFVKKTFHNVFVVPDVKLVQLVPALVVLMAVPLVPTANAVRASTKRTATRSSIMEQSLRQPMPEQVGPH